MRTERKTTRAGFHAAQANYPDPAKPEGDGWRMEGSCAFTSRHLGSAWLTLLWFWVRELSWHCQQCQALAHVDGKCVGCGWQGVA